MKTILTMLLALAGCIPDPPANPETVGYEWTGNAQEDVRAFVGEMMDWHPESTVEITWIAGPCVEHGVYTGERQDPCFIGEYNPWWNPPTAYLVDKWGTVADSSLAHELFHAWSDEILGYTDDDHEGDVWDLEDLAQARIWEWERTLRRPNGGQP